jgi:hypothetical protein
MPCTALPGFATRVSTILFGVILALATLGLAIPTQAAPPVLYHSPADDGVPLPAPIAIGPGASFTAYLYLDGGTNPSSETRCSNGTGDEVCFWNLSLQATTTLTISSFTPEPGIVHHETASSLGINGGDPWRGDLGPRRVGEVVVEGGAMGGALELVSGEYVDSSLVVGTIDPATVVPEPGYGASLLFGALLLGRLARVKRERSNVSFARAPSRARPSRLVGRAYACRGLALALLLSCLSSVPALAQTSADCGDVVSDGVIDVADLDAIRRFLVGDPVAPDLQGDPQALLRCDVTGNGLCDVGDYARIRRYMIDLSGGLNETCPLTATTFAPVLLAAPAVDQAGSLSTDRSSLLLTGTADPDDLIRVEGAAGLPTASVEEDGTWEIDVPLVLDTLNMLQVRRDFGGGYLSEANQIDVTQTNATGEGAIEGAVFDSSASVAGATVTAHGVSVTADEFGRFRIDGIPEGRVIVRVEHPGYVPSAVSAATDTIGFAATPKNSGNGVEVFLVPMAASQTIGAAGGTLTTSSGFELEIPPGALSADTEIALTELVGTDSSDLGGFLTVDIGPGPLTFDPPAILRMPLSGFTPGQPADFLQVDQAAGAVTPRIGLTNASGALEVEILSSAGDDVRQSYGAFRSEVESVGPSTGVPIEKLIAINNCDSKGPSSEIIGGSREPLLFNGDPLGGASPLLRLQLEQDPTTLIETKGLVKARATSEQTVLIPPGSIGLVAVSGKEYTVEQPIYVYRYPEGGGEASKNRLGTLRYLIRVPELAVLEKVEECPKPKASAWGDPHLIRFDHIGEALVSSKGDGRYDFQASGEFVLFESTEDDMVVQSRFEVLPARPNVTITTASAMDVGGDRVSVFADATELEVRIDGTLTPLTVGTPVALPGGGEVERVAPLNTQDQLVVRWPDDSTVTIALLTFLGSQYLNVYPELASGRVGDVQGLLGNANGIIGDDLNLRDGTPADPADLYTTYATSWRISPLESLFDYLPGEDTSTYNGTPPNPDFGIDDLDPVDRAAAEATCIAAGIADDPLLSECVLDVALLGGAATGAALETLDQIPDLGEYVAVSGAVSIFQAGKVTPIDFGGGGGAGLVPVEFPLSPGTNRVLRVLDSAGAVAFSSTGDAITPDGVDFADISWGNWGGLAGPDLRRMGQTLAVFLDGSLPVAIPETFGCGPNDGAFGAPEIGQIFCLGDGLSSVNEAQTFFVPDGATRLFLGFAERLSSQLIESTVHHLGDNFGTNGLFALAPDPEGGVWTSDPFDLPIAFTPGTAQAILDLAETNSGGNSIRVNGQFVANLPNTGTNTGLWTEDVTFVVDPSILLPTGNVIELRAAGGNLDDYLFRDLRFMVTGPFAQLPEPNDPTPHHLGDDFGTNGLFATVPDPEGATWESALFDAPTLDSSAEARILVDLAQTDFTNNIVLVNGVQVGVLPIRTSATEWSTDNRIPFDAALLREFGNRITIRSGSSLGNLDDFLLRDVRVEVTDPTATPPGGYSDNTGIHEFILEVSP